MSQKIGKIVRANNHAPPLDFTVGCEGGFVVLRFSKDISWMQLGPAQAIEVGENMVARGKLLLGISDDRIPKDI